MVGIRRTIKGCAYRKSLQPVWFGVAALLLLVFHVAFDARKLHTILFTNSKITINVAQYAASNQRDLQKDTYELLKQVQNGEKPIFVIEDDLLKNAKDASEVESLRDWNTLNGSFGKGAIVWEDKTGNYPYMHSSYRTFAELPAFSDVECREDLGKRVPNIVHFIWLGKLQMTFVQYLSMRSAATIQKPSLIILHTDSGEPVGKYWKSLRAEIPCLQVRAFPRPAHIFKKYPLKTIQEQSHISRIKVLYQEGGIYANLNVIFVKPFDELMDHSLVLGREEKQYYGNSVILAEKGAPFLLTWFNAYNRRLVDWGTYSTYIPWRIHQENPNAPLHVEEFSMMRPNFQEDDWITSKNWVLDDNFCVHLYTGRDRIKAITQRSPLDAINMDNTYGQLVRIALFRKPFLQTSERRFRNRVHAGLACSVANTSAGSSVPNIVNYVFEGEDFSYKHYLSVRSATRVLKPQSIQIHVVGSRPDNFYWIRMLQEIQCISVINVQKNASASFDSNAYLISYLQSSGGIFLSFDVIITKDFADLMDNHVVIGNDTVYSGRIDVLIARKGTEFMKAWFAWDKKDRAAIGKLVETYIKENPRESISILDKFPVKSPGIGWNLKNFDYSCCRCFSVTKRDTEVSLDEASEYEILRADSLSGRVARVALFGTDQLPS